MGGSLPSSSRWRHQHHKRVLTHASDVFSLLRRQLFEGKHPVAHVSWLSARSTLLSLLCIMIAKVTPGIGMPRSAERDEHRFREQVRTAVRFSDMIWQHTASHVPHKRLVGPCDHAGLDVTCRSRTYCSGT